MHNFTLFSYTVSLTKEICYIFNKFYVFTYIQEENILTAWKSGFNSITLSKSGSADFDFPIARYTVALR